MRAIYPIAVFLRDSPSDLLQNIAMVAVDHRDGRRETRNPMTKRWLPMNAGLMRFDDSRRQFDVRFYLVAILFIIFDLEVAFLFPWAVSLGGIGLFGFWSMMLFLAVLTIGFIYEWKKGALEWE